MQQNAASVPVASEQNGSLDQSSSGNSPDAASRGRVRGLAIAGEAGVDAESITSAHHAVRKGATWGALAGLLLGVTTLTASIIVGAGVGALFGKASQLRLDKGSAPRIHFVNREG